jgi:Tfp pilus assembly PilM family ATPase
MAPLVALEFDGNEARVAVAEQRMGRVVLAQAFTAPLDGAILTAESPPPLAEACAPLAAALVDRGLARCEALLVVGRGNVELRQFAVPAATEEDLPEIVRFQALREFAEMDERWPLDFLPIASAATDSCQVLAAVIKPDLFARLQQLAAAVGLRSRRLLLRPCSTAALVVRTQKSASLADPHRLQLLVHLLGDEVDLIVMRGEQAVLLRTARVSGEPLADAAASAAVLLEVRRTAAAAHNQWPDHKIDRLLLVGTTTRHQALAAALASVGEMAVELFDPLGGIGRGEELDALPADAAPFAPLVGALRTELEGDRHAIDFLHPRRRQPPPSRQGWYIAAVGAAVLLVALYLAITQVTRSRLRAELQDLDGQLQQWTQKAAAAARVEAKFREIEKWAAGDIVWLDELFLLSERLPPAKEVLLSQLEAGSGPRGGEINFEGFALSNEAIKQTDQRLRDARRSPVGKTSNEDQSRKYYQWRFTKSLLISPEKKP